MHIVISTPFYPPQTGILATYAAGIETALKQRGHTVSVVSLGVLGFLPSGIRHFAFFIKLLFALRGAGFVLSLDTWSVGVPAMYAARITRTPLFIRIGGDFLWEQYIHRTAASISLSDFYPRNDFSLKERLIFGMTERMLHQAHAVMFNTGFQKDIWEKAYKLKGKGTVLENFYPPKTETAPPFGRIFVNSNRNTRYKNADRLERVFARVKARHPEITLDTRVLPYVQQLERLAQSYAVIVPSISEVGSNTAIEAVSLGRPFILTNDTGTGERLGACGIFVDTRSEKAIEEAIESILDTATYEKLVANIHAFSFVHFWNAIADEILSKV